MSKPSTSGTLPFMPRSAHTGGTRFAKDDWESFLYSMCQVVGYNLDWFGIDDPVRVYQIKRNTSNTLVCITCLNYYYYSFVVLMISDFFSLVLCSFNSKKLDRCHMLHSEEFFFISPDMSSTIATIEQLVSQLIIYSMDTLGNKLKNSKYRNQL